MNTMSYAHILPDASPIAISGDAVCPSSISSIIPDCPSSVSILPGKDDIGVNVPTCTPGLSVSTDVSATSYVQPVPSPATVSGHFPYSPESPITNTINFHHICNTVTPDNVPPAKHNFANMDSKILKIFNYIVSLSSVSSHKTFETIENLLIYFAGNYLSPDFYSALSSFIIAYFKVNLDFIPDGNFKFNQFY